MTDLSKAKVEVILQDGERRRVTVAELMEAILPVNDLMQAIAPTPGNMSKHAAKSVAKSAAASRDAGEKPAEPEPAAKPAEPEPAPQ